MQAERWKKVEELFEAARQQPAGQRARFLRQACPGDPGLCAEVESLLKAAESGDPLLDGSPLSSIAERPPALKPGDQLGSFEILGLIGRGGMGEVYRARDSRLAREVAIKVLRAETGLTQERRRRFEIEARAASSLNHPNILTIYDFGEERGLPFIVTELLTGESLRDVMERGPLPIKSLLDMAVQIADGLTAAHTAGITHRDLKPENLFLTGERVTILDFGLAKAAAVPSPDDATQTLAQQVTSPGSLVGTIAYMSPEQAQGRPVDYRSDQLVRIHPL